MIDARQMKSCGRKQRDRTVFNNNRRPLVMRNDLKLSSYHDVGGCCGVYVSVYFRCTVFDRLVAQ